MFWIKDKEAFVATEEFGQDLEHVEVLQRKFEEFQKDMASQVNKDLKKVQKCHFGNFSIFTKWHF